MKLNAISYNQFVGEEHEWVLPGLTLGPINLLVGRNATGKTKTLNLINSLARLLAGDQKPVFTSTNFVADFQDGNSRIRFKTNIKAAKVLSEELSVDGSAKLKRGPGGLGEIWAEKLNTMMEFQTPDDQMASVARRDQIQHPFLEGLYQWGKGVLHYRFGSPLGQDHLAIVTDKKVEEPDWRDPASVVGLFRKADKQYPESFRASIKEDMQNIGYDLEDLDTGVPFGIVAEGAPGPLVGLRAKERDLPTWTDQTEMSQGMWRALSLLVHTTYFRMAGTPTCVLIDDVGEGLDFERSTSLIKVLAERAAGTNQQLAMTTNDRFVMNSIPLEAWSVLRRQGTSIVVLNYGNSKRLFDDFKFTGLNNFDFLATDFASREATP